jgi:hypothetical protein
VTIRAAIVAKDARQSDDQPVNDAPSGADIKDAAPTHAAREKSRRGPKAKPAIEPSDIQGLKYFDKLKPLLARLHDVGTERDNAHNRDLHMDEYCIVVLMWMFSTGPSSDGKLRLATDLPDIPAERIAAESSLPTEFQTDSSAARQRFESRRYCG